MDTDSELWEEVRRVTAYVNLVLGAIGILGNMATARLMMSSKMENISTAAFILVATLSDVTVVVFQCADDVAYFLNNSTAEELLHGDNRWRCRASVFFYESALLMSSWLIVAMAVEPCLALSESQRWKKVYNVGRALNVNIALIMVMCAACFPFLVITTISKDEFTCTSKYRLFFDLYRDLVLHVIIDYAIPLLFCAVCIILLVRHKYASNENTINHQSNNTSSFAKKAQYGNFILATITIFFFFSIPSVTTTCIRLSWNHNLNSNWWATPENSNLAVAELLAQTLLLVIYCNKFILLAVFEDDVSFSSYMKLVFKNKGNKSQRSQHYIYSGSYLNNGLTQNKAKRRQTIEHGRY